MTPPASTATAPPATPAPTTIETTAPSEPPLAYIATVPEVTAYDLGSSWHDGCRVGPEQLRAVDVTYWGYDAAVRTGRLIVAAEVTADIAGIMGDLFEMHFPIERITPMDLFGGSDNASAFNCRSVTGGAGWSEHAFGEAIDLNPVANP